MLVWPGPADELGHWHRHGLGARAVPCRATRPRRRVQGNRALRCRRVSWLACADLRARRLRWLAFLLGLTAGAALWWFLLRANRRTGGSPGKHIALAALPYTMPLPRCRAASLPGAIQGETGRREALNVDPRCLVCGARRKRLARGCGKWLVRPATFARTGPRGTVDDSNRAT